MINWLIDYCCTSHSRFFSLIWRLHRYRWRAAKFRPMLVAHGLWAGRDLHHATPTVIRGLGFSGLYKNDWLIINCFPSKMINYCFPSRSRIFHWYEDVTITGKGLQNLTFRVFEQGGIFIVPHRPWHLRDFGFFRSLQNWLIAGLLFFVPLKNFSLIWRRHHYQRRAYARRSWPLSREGSLSVYKAW
jgi:hypothetical protein